MNINEIFTSISGEPDGFGNQGGLATFVRLQGCNLTCTWCDTKHSCRPMPTATMSIEEVAKLCTSKHIIITGGEPLLQFEEVYELIDLLCPMGRQLHLITIETNGAIPVLINCGRTSYSFLRFVVDYKLDSSCMEMFMQPEVFDNLYALDVIKFVIKDLQDYRQAKELVLRNSQWAAKKIFSPVMCDNWPVQLAGEMVKDKFEEACFSLQWHRLLKLR